MDWAEILERMYTRWASSQGHQLTVLDRSRGEEAGIKAVEMQIEGRFAYGYLKGTRLEICLAIIGMLVETLQTGGQIGSTIAILLSLDISCPGCSLVLEQE